MQFQPAPAGGPGAARARVGRRVLDVVFGLTLAAGLLKFSDIPLFEGALSTWSLMPGRFVHTLGLLVPAAEVSVSLVWFLRLWPAIAVSSRAAMPGVFAGAFALQAAILKPPKCVCFGSLSTFDRLSDQTWMVLGRNAILLGAVLAGWLLGRDGSARAPGRRSARAPAGFTLLETLIVVALVGVLVSLLLPLLGRTRNLAQSTASLSNLRSHGGVMAAYLGDWKDTFPFFMNPRATGTVLRCRDHAFVSNHYFAAHATWNYALAPLYYNGECSHQSFYPPGYPWSGATARTWVTFYFYPCAFIALSDYRNRERRTGPEQWRPTRSDMVETPTKKIQLISWYPIIKGEP
jgi:prepilin-type N-terminal cleavage/methylation domain-containing protein